MSRAIKPVDGIAWKLSTVQDFPAFLTALPSLVPEGSVLYIESGGKPPQNSLSVLQELSTGDSVKVPGGTLLPRPVIYTIPITRENMQKLAAIEQQHSTPVGVFHLHVYLDSEMLLSSYDAFLDPFKISLVIPEERVKTFSDTLGCSYEKTE